MCSCFLSTLAWTNTDDNLLFTVRGQGKVECSVNVNMEALRVSIRKAIHVSRLSVLELKIPQKKNINIKTTENCLLPLDPWISTSDCQHAGIRWPPTWVSDHWLTVFPHTLGGPVSCLGEHFVRAAIPATRPLHLPLKHLRKRPASCGEAPKDWFLQEGKPLLHCSKCLLYYTQSQSRGSYWVGDLIFIDLPTKVTKTLVTTWMDAINSSPVVIEKLFW